MSNQNNTSFSLNCTQNAGVVVQAKFTIDNERVSVDELEERIKACTDCVGSVSVASLTKQKSHMIVRNQIIKELNRKMLLKNILYEFNDSENENANMANESGYLSFYGDNLNVV